MFCYQCQEATKGEACVVRGVCGKDPDMESLQETLLYGLKGMGAYAHHARRLGMVDETTDIMDVHLPLVKLPITPGKNADFVLLAGNPLQDISAVRRPVAVFKGDRWYDPARLYEAVGIRPFTR